jgi:hypothetical protein
MLSCPIRPMVSSLLSLLPNHFHFSSPQSAAPAARATPSVHGRTPSGMPSKGKRGSGQVLSRVVLLPWSAFGSQCRLQTQVPRRLRLPAPVTKRCSSNNRLPQGAESGRGLEPVDLLGPLRRPRCRPRPGPSQMLRNHSRSGDAELTVMPRWTRIPRKGLCTLNPFCTLIRVSAHKFQPRNRNATNQHFG